MLQCVAVCCSVLQCVASVLQCVALCCTPLPEKEVSFFKSKAVVAKHLFAFSVFARGNSIGARTDNSIDTELGKLLG